MLFRSVIDIKVFFLTVVKVFKRDGVVEGGTGAIKENQDDSQTEEKVA